MRLAQKLADALDYVGVLALELFLTKDGKLLANEFAPRVHNSGHWTQDACLTGQFEQHIRAVCGWPLGDPSRQSDGEMINLLGEDAHGLGAASDRRARSCISTASAPRPTGARWGMWCG